MALLPVRALCYASCSLSHWLALIVGSLAYLPSGDSSATVCAVFSEVSLARQARLQRVYSKYLVVCGACVLAVL